MTSITITKSEAVRLAETAAHTYARRVAGYPPAIGRERLQEMIREIQTGKVGKLALSEEQHRTHVNTLREQNDREGLENARFRAEDLAQFFRAESGPVGVVTISFDDWSFLVKAETIKVQ
jgi:ketol-acid reductoisomerase